MNAQVVALLTTALGIVAAIIKWKMYVESDEYALKTIRKQIADLSETLREALGKNDSVVASRCQRKLMELREQADCINDRRTNTANTKGPVIPR